MTKMISELFQRIPHKNWKTALILFMLILIVHIAAAFFKSLFLNFIGMSLYIIVPLICIKRSLWKEIRIKKPINSKYILWGTLLIVFIVVITSIIYYFIWGLTTSNYMVIMAKQQMGYGVINKANEWKYFPIAALGFCLISPFTEEFFYRGLLLKALEYRFRLSIANIIHAFLFGIVHLFYFGLVEFNWGLLLFIPIGLPGSYLFGWIVQKTESVFSSVILHIVHNFIVILLVYTFIIPVIG
ncbi:MAG: type II CAAX endopeptidase family protein [Bacteroidia bacterium]|nr:type II CAAX endopeptidase family protein [Bacteroidia bacterium]